MRLVLRLFLVVLILSPLVLGGLIAVFGISATPRFFAQSELDAGQIARAERLVRDHDPRRLNAGEVRSITLTAEEANLVFANVLRRFARADGRIELSDGGVRVVATFALPDNPLGRFLNIEAEFAAGDQMPVLERVKVGRLPIPRLIARLLYGRFIALLDERGGQAISRGLLKDVAFTSDTMSLTYEWQPDLLDAARAQLVSDDLRARVEAHQGNLARVTGENAVLRELPLSVLLNEAMRFAASRSAGGDPQEENRAAIIVVEAYVNRRDLSILIPEYRSWPRATPRYVSLLAREDFAQHFVLSAALSVWGNEQIANAIGLHKEVDDSRGGSGFSFRDLAADRAGTRFGELAVRSPNSARRLHEVFAPGLTDRQLLPDMTGLPENLTDRAFQRQFGSIDSDAYRALTDLIEARLDELEIFR